MSRTITALIDHAEGLRPVRARQPGARKAGVLGEHNGALKVAVAAPPEDGRANQALIEALRRALGVKRSQVELIGGQGCRDKRFLIRGVLKSDLEKRLAAIV